MNQYDLNGQTAIVTGGAQGIGRAVVDRMRASRANVAIWDFDMAAAEATAADTGATAYQVDVRDLDAVTAAAAQVNADFGSIEVFVNSAGIAGPNHLVVEYPPEDWQQILDINLTGTFNCCKAILPYMVAREYGRVMNIASIAGKEGNAFAGPYAASKAGVIALTKALGKEYASLDIAVNCVAPAAARTRIFDQLEEEFIQMMLSKIPRGRFLEVKEAAELITWACTRANSFTTGAVFDLSGGRATY